jgi:hypothetical protein
MPTKICTYDIHSWHTQQSAETMADNKGLFTIVLASNKLKVKFKTWQDKAEEHQPMGSSV